MIPEVVYRKRPRWLGRLAMWWFDNEWVPMPRSWAPHVLGLGLGRKGHRVKP
jgi:hypothetical protein